MTTPLVHALRFAARRGIDDRAGVVAATRAAGARFLDEAFARETSIPELPNSWLLQIEAADTILPPRTALARGNQDLSGLSFLVSLGRWLDAQTVFEIGTYNGVTARCLAINLDHATVQTLDLPDGSRPAFALEPGDSLHLNVGLADSVATCARVQFLQGDSGTFDFEPFNKSCDLVYVDGAHSLEYVISDSNHALAMLRDRGAIVWDDYRRGMQGVVRALDQLSTRMRLHRVPGTRLVVHLTSTVRAELEAGDA